MTKKKKIEKRPAPQRTTVTPRTSPGSFEKIQGKEKNLSFFDKVLRPHILFAILAFFFGTSFLITTPPFQVPDEIAHFDRAFKLSEFGTFQKIEDNKSGDYIPANIDSTLWLFRYVTFHPEQKIEKQKILDAFKIPLDEKRRKFVNIDAGPYFYFSYLPQYPAIYLGKLFNWNVLTILYLGRFLALLFYILCVSYAIRIIPTGRWLLMVIALMPMCLAQAGSSNADCVLFSLSFLVVAILLKLSYERQKLTWNTQNVLLFASLLIIGVLKIVYLPLAFLIFILPKIVFKNNLRYYATTSLLIILSALFTITWFKMNSLSALPPDPSFDTAGKIKALLNNPFISLKILSQTINYSYEGYYQTTIGVLGYLDTVLKDGVYKTFTFLIIFLALFESDKKYKISIYQRVIFFLVAAAVFAGTIIAMHFVNPKQNGFIATGVQGRYFIPVLFPFFMAVHGLIPFKLNLSKYKILILLLFVILFFTLLSTQLTILERYYDY